MRLRTGDAQNPRKHTDTQIVAWVCVVLWAAAGAVGAENTETKTLRALQSEVVRVHLTSGQWRDGRLLEVAEQSLVLELKSNGVSDTLALVTVRSVYRNRGRGPTLGGIVLGAVAGFVVGATVAAHVHEDCADCGAGFNVLYGGVGAAALGVIVGSVSFHRWQRVYGEE